MMHHDVSAHTNLAGGATNPSLMLGSCAKVSLTFSADMSGKRPANQAATL